VRSVVEDWNIQLLFLFASQFDIAEVGPVWTEVLTALWCSVGVVLLHDSDRDFGSYAVVVAVSQKYWLLIVCDS